MTVNMPERDLHGGSHVAIRPSIIFEGCGENPYDRTTISQLLAGLIVIVSFGALTLTFATPD